MGLLDKILSCSTEDGESRERPKKKLNRRDKAEAEIAARGVPTTTVPKNNFYSPINADFYTKMSEPPLDKGKQEIHLLRISISRTTNTEQFELISNLSLNEDLIYWALSYYSERTDQS